MKFCKNCNVGLSDELHICPFCGGELSDTTGFKVSDKEIQKEQKKENTNLAEENLVDVDQKETEIIEPDNEIEAAASSEKIFRDEKVQAVPLEEKPDGPSVKKPKYGKMIGAVLFMILAVVFFLIAVILILIYVTDINDKSKVTAFYIGIVFLCLGILFIILNRVQIKKYKQSKSS